MNLIKTIKNKMTAQHKPCGCHDHHAAAGETEAPTKITKDMIVREVTERWPQTVSVFGNHKVDFCCGGAHSIQQTADARGCRDVDALVADLNRAIKKG